MLLGHTPATNINCIGIFGYNKHYHRLCYIVGCNVVFHGRTLNDLLKSRSLFHSFPVFIDILLQGDIQFDMGQHQNLDTSWNDISVIIDAHNGWINPNARRFNDVEPLLGDKSVIRKVKYYSTLQTQFLLKLQHPSVILYMYTIHC